MSRGQSPLRGPQRGAVGARVVAPRTASLAAAGLLCLAGLTGCGADQGELQQWMEQQRREVRPSVEPLEPPKKFDPAPYTMAETTDPFSLQKLSVALRQEVRAPSSLLAGEINRRKDPLEAYPLDAMQMVGSVSKQGVPVALLKVDKLLYQVKPGDYVGQNYGKITKITETDVSLREIVQDAAGEWIERPASLQLQEQAR